MISSLICAGGMQWGILADCIKKHENSAKYPYGCHHMVSGHLKGWPEPEARGICIRLCQKVYAKWQAEGSRGDFFDSLNKVYAQDQKWHLDVEKKYLASISGNSAGQHRKID